MAIKDEAIEAMARAMREAVIRDDEGEFPRLFDMLDFSGENKAHTVVRGLATAAFTACMERLKEPTPDMIEAGMVAMHNGHAYDDATAEAWQAMIAAIEGDKG